MAVIVTVCCALTLAGAVYNPLALIDPAPVAGVTAQVTAVFAAFATVAVNCCVPAPYTVGVAGPTDTVIGGESVAVTVPVVTPSAWLLAVIVTICCALTFAGAVYTPVVPPMDPGAPLGIDQVTPELQPFATVSENCRMPLIMRAQAWDTQRPFPVPYGFLRHRGLQGPLPKRTMHI